MQPSARPSASGTGGTSAPSRWPYGPVTWAELTGGLVWPTLLRAPAIGLQPPRVVVGVIVAALLIGAARLADWLIGAGWDDGARGLLARMTRGLDAAATHVLNARLILAGETLYDGTVGAMLRLVEPAPLKSVVVLALLIPIWAVGGMAMSRMAAVDVALNLNMGVREGLRFALRRWKSAIFSLLIPAIAALLVVLVLAAGGGALLSLPYVSVLGGLLYGVGLALGLVMVLLLTGFVLGQMLLLPAAAIEGTDAADAVQRTYAYVLGRTGRAVLYTVIALAQMALVYAIARWAVEEAQDLTGRLTTAWLSDARAGDLLRPDEREASAASWLISFWRDALGVLLGGAMISVFFSSGSVLYLLLRRVNDEQDVRDIWMPGEIPGVTGEPRR